MDDKNAKLDSQNTFKYFSKLAYSLSKTTFSEVITFTVQISESKHTQFKMGQKALLKWGFVLIETYFTVINFISDNQKEVE